MTREEILAIAKPVLFNTEMTRAVKDNRKTVTRRPIKSQPKQNQRIEHVEGTQEWVYISEWAQVDALCKRYYRPGDILYVPEAWRCTERCTTDFYEIEFRDGEKVKVDFTSETRRQKWLKYIDKPRDNWQSPYFMPKEASRLFLRVTDVRAEKLQSMLPCDIQREGCPYRYSGFDEEQAPDWYGWMKNVWDTTIKPADLALYGWDANPWVRAIEFEKMEVKK